MGKEATRKVIVSHADRAKRRKEVAEHLRQNGMKATCEKFEVTYGYVQQAAKEHEIPLEGTKDLPAEQTFVALRLMLEGKTQSEVARALEMTRQRVHQIAQKARTAGFNIQNWGLVDGNG